MLQIKNAFGLFGIDILLKNVDGKMLDDNLLNTVNNGTIIVQKNNNSPECCKIQQKTSPISQ
jgi:hypothetical protein